MRPPVPHFLYVAGAFQPSKLAGTAGWHSWLVQLAVNFLRDLPLVDESEELPIPDRIRRMIIKRGVRVGKN